MSSAPSLLTLLLNFFRSLMGLFVGDITYELNWLGWKISYLFSSWGSSFSGYGPWIPALFVAVIGVTVAGLYLVFVFVDAGKDVVGA